MTHKYKFLLSFILIGFIAEARADTFFSHVFFDSTPIEELTNFSISGDAIVFIGFLLWIAFVCLFPQKKQIKGNL